MPRRFLAIIALSLSVVFSGCDNSKPKQAEAAVPKTEVASERVTWLTDLDEGIKVAKTEKKAILVDFTGSDWCGWCIRLKKEVFDQKEFVAATKDFVLVELDYPQKKQQSPEEKAKNKAWAEKFSIEGFPTIMLLDSNGEPFAQTGYEAGGPVKYLAHLAELMKSNTSEGKAKFAQGKKEGKEKATRSAKNRELSQKIETAIAAKDFKAAEAVLNEIYDGASDAPKGVFHYMKARILLRIDPSAKTEALKYLDEALKASTGDEALTRTFQSYRDKVSAGSTAPKVPAEAKKGA